MSLARKLVLSVYLIAVVIFSITTDESLLWLKVVMFGVFLIGLFWPEKSKDSRSRRSAP